MKTGLLLCFLLVCSLTVTGKHHGGPAEREDREGKVGGRRPETPDEGVIGKEAVEEDDSDGDAASEPEPQLQDSEDQEELEADEDDEKDHRGSVRSDERESDEGNGKGRRGHRDNKRRRCGKSRQGERQGRRGGRRHGRPGGDMFLRFLQRRPHILCTICTVLNNTQVKEATVKALTEDNTCQQKREAEKQEEGPSHGRPADNPPRNSPDLKNATVVSAIYDKTMEKICEPNLKGSDRRN